ncbi:MAG: PEP-CTERM sorting domain-containing protein [Opitutaceae bacterium]|nr:PEP-CTERM sorting domain-containing protein [Opitutaceae bacterium]
MKRILTLCFSLFVVLAGASSVQAGLLVYEGFDGYTPGAGLEGSTPNENTVGLDTTRAYVDDSENPRYTDTVLADGLTFGSLRTSGGALGFSNTGGTGIEPSVGTNVIGAYLSSDASGYTGDLWNSYLVNLAIQGDLPGDGMGIRIGSSPATSNSGFNSWADSRNSSENVGVGYNFGHTRGETGAAGLELDTTYIIISCFTNAGVALSGSVNGTATLWALTEAQFADFLATGGDETALANALVTATTSQTVNSGTQTFAGAFGFVSVNDAGTIDELRWGSSLESVIPVVPVPEPATVALVLGMGAGLLGMACRLRHQA